MGMHRFANKWLSGTEVKKDSSVGMGSALVGPSVGEVIMKLAAVQLICKACGSETTLAEARDDGRCSERTCKGRLKVKDEDADEGGDDSPSPRGVNAPKPGPFGMAKDEDADENDDDQKRKATFGGDDDEPEVPGKRKAAYDEKDDEKRARKTGGRLDGRPLFEQRRKRVQNFNSPRQPYVRD